MRALARNRSICAPLYYHTQLPHGNLRGSHRVVLGPRAMQVAKAKMGRAAWGALSDQDKLAASLAELGAAAGTRAPGAAEAQPPRLSRSRASVEKAKAQSATERQLRQAAEREVVHETLASESIDEELHGLRCELQGLVPPTVPSAWSGASALDHSLVPPMGVDHSLQAPYLGRPQLQVDHSLQAPPLPGNWGNAPQLLPRRGRRARQSTERSRASRSSIALSAAGFRQMRENAARDDVALRALGRANVTRQEHDSTEDLAFDTTVAGWERFDHSADPSEDASATASGAAAAVAPVAAVADQPRKAGATQLHIDVLVIDDTYQAPALSSIALDLVALGCPYHGRRLIKTLCSDSTVAALCRDCAQDTPFFWKPNARWQLCWDSSGRPGPRISPPSAAAAGTWTLEEAGIGDAELLWLRYAVPKSGSGSSRSGGGSTTPPVRARQTVVESPPTGAVSRRRGVGEKER